MIDLHHKIVDGLSIELKDLVRLIPIVRLRCFQTLHAFAHSTILIALISQGLRIKPKDRFVTSLIRVHIIIVRVGCSCLLKAPPMGAGQRTNNLTKFRRLLGEAQTNANFLSMYAGIITRFGGINWEYCLSL